MHALTTAIQADPFTAAMILALLFILWRRDRRHQWDAGWDARGHHAAAHTLAEKRRQTSIRE